VGAVSISDIYIYSLKEFVKTYHPKKNFKEKDALAKKFKIDIPDRLCLNLSQEKYNDLYKATIVHEKPLENFYGENFKNILTIDYLSRLFEKI
jgi:3-deoxy-alpha-D-manno-octulosonate 8-oxidase